MSPERREEAINLGNGPLSASPSAGSTRAEGKVRADRSVGRQRYLGKGGGVLMGEKGPMLNSIEPLGLRCGNALCPDSPCGVGRRVDSHQALSTPVLRLVEGGGHLYRPCVYRLRGLCFNALRRVLLGTSAHEAMWTRG